MLCVIPRQELETTGFYPDDFLPLASLEDSLHHTWCDDQLEMIPSPKGKPFLSRFAIQAHVEPKQPLEIARRADMELDQGVSRGGYVLCLDALPVSSTVAFHLHHEKSHVIFCSQDPQLYDKQKALEDPLYLQKLAIVDNIPVTGIGLSTPPVSPDSPDTQGKTTTSTRYCVVCKKPFTGPAGRLAAYCWPHGYDDAYALAIFCSQCAQ